MGEVKGLTWMDRKEGMGVMRAWTNLAHLWLALFQHTVTAADSIVSCEGCFAIRAEELIVPSTLVRCKIDFTRRS